MKRDEFQYLVKEVIRECVAEGILPRKGKNKPQKTMKRSELKERIKQFVRESLHEVRSSK
jgi:hypothetical protein